VNLDRACSRRRFLRAAGVAIALPFMPSLFPARAFAGGTDDPPAPPKRLIFLSVPLGFIPNPWIAKGDFERSGGFTKSWLPETDGADYQMPETHAALEPFRHDLSFLKGLCHQKFRGDSHQSDEVLLTGADTKVDPSRSFANTISCDQVAAASSALAGKEVRHPSLTLGIPPGGMGSSSGGLSWSANGTPVSPVVQACRLFDMLFGTDEVPKEVRLARFADRRSMLDATLAQVEDMKRSLNPADQRKLDEVTESVRQVERDIQREQTWLDAPKPKVDFPRPPETFRAPIHDGIGDFGFNSAIHVDAMLKLAHAAFLTDSTRIITFELPEIFTEITQTGKHGLAHPRCQQDELDHMAMDKAVSNRLAGFLKLLKDTPDHDGKPLLHHTCGALGSGCWGAHHGMRSLPIMTFGNAGGRIKQGESRKFPDPTPLANLWLTMMQACGVDEKSFADSTGTLTEIQA
jgi:hypothetical protein